MLPECIGRITQKAQRTVQSLAPARFWIMLCTGLLLTQILAACSLYTVRPIQSQANGGQSNQNFDSAGYASSIWDSKVIPTVEEKAVELTTLLPALRENSDAAQKEYAKPSSDGFYNFMVKGQGQVLAVNTDSRAGSMTIQLPSAQDTSTITIQIGPVITGTSIRDSVGFIDFNQFTNQVQYAQVADSLNVLAVKNLPQTDFKTLIGKTVSFSGSFTYISVKQITITPVKLTI